MEGGERAQDAIGIFDSGVGGLTVVSEVMKELPCEKIIYFGDTARVPYGSKSKETVTKYAMEIMDFLIKERVKAVIVACNTVSSNSYEELTERFSLPIFEMVKSGVSSPELEGCKRVGVIGTTATIGSGAYEREIKRVFPETEVFSKACPLFVPLAEEGCTFNEIARLTCEMYLRPLMDMEIEALLLGCTHYPLLTEQIKQIAGNAKIVNPAVCAAKNIKLYLEKEGMLNKSLESPQHKFFVSDNTLKFNEISRLVLKDTYEAVKVNIV